MSDPQLSLLHEAVPATGAALVVDAEVLLYGTNASSLPRHRRAGALRTASAEAVDRMLDLAEEALRHLQAPEPRLTVPQQRTRGLGTSGTIGINALMADANGISDLATGESATWRQLLGLLAALRADEPDIARARDLAEAYRYLHHHSRVDGGPGCGSTSLLIRLRSFVIELGGDPDLVAARSSPG